MPVVAVAGAAVAIGVAAEVGTTFAVIAAVGATIGAVGAVTGVKELQIAGAAIGVVGAVGGLAQGAGLIGDLGTAGSASNGAVAVGTTTDTAAPVLSAGDSIDAEIANWSTYGSQGAGSGVLSGAQNYGTSPTDTGGWNDVVNTVTGQAQGPEVSLTAANVNAAPPDVTPTVADVGDNPGNPGGIQMDSSGAPLQGDNPTAVGGSVINPASPSPTAPQSEVPGMPSTGATPTGTAATPGATPTATPTAESLINGGNISTPGFDIAKSSSTWKDIKDFLKTSGGGMLGFGVLQAGGSFLSGAMNGLTPAQIDALHAQANANIAAANLAQQQQQGLQLQQANMNARLPVAVRQNVTGAPGGLINTPPQAPVTGQVAA